MHAAVQLLADFRPVREFLKKQPLQALREDKKSRIGLFFLKERQQFFPDPLIALISKLS